MSASNIISNSDNHAGNSLGLTPISNPTWAGPSLFTPMYIEALMVGQKNQTGDWGAVAVQYNQLGLRGGQPQPTPFQTGTAPSTGIHLIWTVPNAMRHGQVETGGSVDFPLLPNRWIVTRSFIAKPGDVPQITAWVLESDYLGPQGSGTHAYPDPSGGTVPYYIGRRFDLGNWNGPTSTYNKPFLQAMGPGNATYVAIYDNMTNVLAFHDDMQNAAEGFYSYSSCGWFGTPADDLLMGTSIADPAGFTTEEQWQTLMQQFLWTVGNDADQTDAEQAWQAWLQTHPITGGPALTEAQKLWPGQNVCHGLVYNLEWKGFAEFYPINAILHGDTPPTVAIGANAAESMSAWLASAIGSSDAEMLLQAFQQDMIFDYASNPSVFYTRSQTARFSAEDGGRQWVVYQEDQTSSATTIPSGTYTAPLDHNATTTLTTLNRQQIQLDQDMGMMASLKWQLYAAYWKLENYPRTQPAWGQLSQQQIDTLTPQIAALQQQIDVLAAQTEQTRADLQSQIAPLKLKINSLNQARYTYRQDPVILLAGANQDTKFSPPGVAGAENLVFTRFTGQTIYAIEVAFSNAGVVFDVTLSSSDFADIIWPVSALIPKEMPDYWFETFLLDTNNAQLMAQRAAFKAGVTLTPDQLILLTGQIQRQQTLAWNQQAVQLLDVRIVSQTAGLLGVLPAKSSVAAWTPPWAPVYLDWEIEWHPSAATPQHMLDSWTLGEFEFRWDGTEVTPTAGIYSGRSILNGQAAQGLEDKLNHFLNTDPNAGSLPQYQIDELREMAQTIGQFDVLTQSMSGMIQQLIMQQLQMSKLNANQSAALNSLLADAASYLPAAGASVFFPLHAGHFRITRLQLVDAYGQLLRGSQLSDNLQPIRSSSLVTEGINNQKYMQLTPRVTQNLRLDFRMVQYDDDSIRSNSSDQTSAISGWIIPNHINHSLIVFDPDGNNLGEVIMIGSGNDVSESGTGLRWDAVPGKNSVLGAAPDFGPSLRHLNSFVNALLLRGAQGSQALQNLLDVIDSSLWNVDPLGQPMQGNLAILLGRPIALVRALATLETGGSPASNQSWQNTGANVTDDFMHVPLPLRVGDIGLSNNGVMGYFLDDDYSQLYPYYGYDQQLAIPRNVIADRTLAPDAMLSRMSSLLESYAEPAPGSQEASGDPYIVSDPVFSLKPDGVTTHALTMLVDPRGWIPAISGYLPVQWLSLPPGPVNNALSAMFVTFRTGPVLLDPPETSQPPQLPLPANIKGKWTWVERSGVTTWSESAELSSSDPVAQLPAIRPILSEGWLKLSGADGR